MKRFDWVLGCALASCVVGGLTRSAMAQFGGEQFGRNRVGGQADDPFGVPSDEEEADVEEEAETAHADTDGPGTDADSGDRCRCVGHGDSAAASRIQRALDAPLISAGIEFVDQPLEQVIMTLQDDYEIPMQLDIPALENAGIGPDEKISISLRNISLRSALRLMLKQIQLTYIIQDEVLTITTPEEAEAQLVVCVYDVRDLLCKVASGPARPIPMGSSCANCANAEFDPLVDTIVSCVATETWSEHGGGEAEIRPLPPGLLIISQTQAVHEEIRSLLRAIRSTIAEGTNDKDTDEASLEASMATDSNAVVTRHYLLPIGDVKDPDYYRQKIVQLVTRLTPAAGWDSPLADGQMPILTALPDRLVVRHRESVQNNVQTALQDLGLTSPWQGTTSKRSGFGGDGGGFGGGGMFQIESATE